MKLMYLILISALTPCISHSMEIVQHTTPREKVTQENIPQRVRLKDVAPQITHINLALTPITFHKKTKPFWTFCNNEIFKQTSVKTLRKNPNSADIYVLEDKKTISDLDQDQAYVEAIAQGNSFYYSNIEKKYLNEQSKKFIRYGTLVVFFSRNYNHMEPQDLKESLEHDAAIFMAHHVASKKELEKPQIDQ